MRILYNDPQDTFESKVIKWYAIEINIRSFIRARQFVLYFDFIREKIFCSEVMKLCIIGVLLKGVSGWRIIRARESVFIYIIFFKLTWAFSTMVSNIDRPCRTEKARRGGNFSTQQTTTTLGRIPGGSAGALVWFPRVC